MIKVEKDFTNIPDILNSPNRKEAFEQNVKDGAFNHGKTLYKPDELKNRLHNIYNKKCVYCEDSLLNSPKAIEHYRPKDIYYWLAYSWDNLLLCCTSCNGSKGINFETKKRKVAYTLESFEDIHNLSDSYNKDEEPMLINPEKDDIINDLIFNVQSEISSKNDRVDYTIRTCTLNREELRQLREEILTDFVQIVDDYKMLLDESNNQDKGTIVLCFGKQIKQFIEKCDIKNKFYSFRYFILNNINIFIVDKRMQNIVKTIIKKIGTNLNQPLPSPS